MRANKILTLMDSYKKNEMNIYEYMAKIHEFNKVLFYFPQRLKNSDIKSIEITESGLIFSFKSTEIKMFSDMGCRSATLETLNFSKYEPGDSDMVFKLIQDQSVIFDVGAHIGWYTLQFAKRCPNAKIYSFEPMPTTFTYLESNLELNDVNNVQAFNFGLGAIKESQIFHYFGGGSAIASAQNLIDHEKTEKIPCLIKKLDDVVQNLEITKMDFLKCDAEGAELFILQGGLQSLKEFLPIIYIELVDLWCQKFAYTVQDVANLLRDLGYESFSASYPFLNKEDVINPTDEKYNFFFLHSEKHKHIIEKYSSFVST